MSDLHKSPCQELNCQRCCYETEMTLTEEDVERISGLGYKGYYTLKDGYFQMINIDGRCFFLREGFCLIHDDKPVGCRLYPLVLDIDDDEVVLHGFCKFAKHFKFDYDDIEHLRVVIRTEERERRLRLASKRKKKRLNKP